MEPDLINIPRSNWANVFKKVVENTNDEILDFDYIENDWDKEEWTW